MEVINSVATLVLINYTTTVTTRFCAHKSVSFKCEGLGGRARCCRLYGLTVGKLQCDAWVYHSSLWSCFTIKQSQFNVMQHKPLVSLNYQANLCNVTAEKTSSSPQLAKSKHAQVL